MRSNTVSNLKFKDFNDSKVIQIKQGDTTPIAVKIDNSPSMNQSKEKATIYLSNKDKNVVFKNEFEVNKGIVTFFVNQVLPAGIYSLQINYLGKKYPSVDSYYLRINPSADIAPEEIKDLETIEMIEEMILESVNSKVHEQVANTIHNEVATYLEENADKFKGKDGLDGINGVDGKDGIDGKSITFDDLTEEQKQALQGQQGISGLSAYEIAHLNGFEGSEEEWLVSLQGKQGSDGSQGIDGKSAYQIAVEKGYEGSQTDWLTSLKGERGEQGKSLEFDDLTEEQKLSLKGEKGDKGDRFVFDDFTSEELELLSGKDGKPFTYDDFTYEQLVALRGEDGKSISVTDTEVDEENNTTVKFSDGTSIMIPRGLDGLDGKDGKSLTFDDLTPEQINLLKGTNGRDGINGKSAYELATQNGFTGNLAEWLESLKGKDGKDGEQGIKGESGTRGADGKSITVKSTTVDSSGNTLVTFSDNSTVVVAKGADGVNGTDGKNGKDGIDGKDGKSLTFNDLTSQQKLELKGAKGDKGDRGEKGIDGLKGDKGDKGDPFKYSDFTQEQLQSLKGAKGDKGDTGAKGADGKDGIQYDTTNWQKYKLTNDDGTRRQITLANNIDNLHNLDTGYYYATGTPITGASSTAGLLTVELNGVKTVKFITFRPYNSSQLWVKRYYNAWGDWERVDLKIEDLNIQKHKFTEENGDRIRISDIDPVDLESGYYQMWRVKNAPVGNDSAGSYWNIDVTTAFDDVKQIKAVLSYTGQTFQKNIHKGNDSGWKELIDKDTLDKRTEFSGALVKLKENQPFASNTYAMAIWGGAIYNTDGYWNPENPTRLTVPKGVTKVKVLASILWESNSDGFRQLRLKKNGNYTYGLPYVRYQAVSTSGATGTSSVIEVEEGDYFELDVVQTSGKSINLREDPYTWMSIEAVEMSKEFYDPSFMLVGHRGATGYAPEHSMRGYHMAIDKGADYIELDLQLTKDNKLLCMHDSTLDRTTTGTGLIQDKTLAEIQSSYTLKEGDKIPSLEDVLEEFGNSVKYYIETKRPFDMNMDKELLKQLKNYKLIGFGTQKFGVIIQSFAKESLINIKNQYSNIPLVYLSNTFTESYIQEAFDNGFYAVAPKYTTITKELVDNAHNKGLKVHTWTVNNTVDMRDMESKGVDGIFTNYLDRYFE